MKYPIGFLLHAVVFIHFSCESTQKINDDQYKSMSNLEELAIQVSKEQNRPFSFTNKKSAYYYSQTHRNDHPEYTYFAGLNIAQKRIFSGYELFVDGVKLDNELSEVTVYPQKLVRKHPKDVMEEFWLLDYENVLEVGLQNLEQSSKVAISLIDAKVDTLLQEGAMAVLSPQEGEYRIGVSTISHSTLVLNGPLIETNDPSGFFILVSRTLDEMIDKLKEIRERRTVLKNQREERLSNLIESNGFISSNIDQHDRAMRWMIITMDQLVTKQQGNGIYAGLPWFNEYWGRDEFISTPGACLVLGDFDVTRDILLSFARYQETHPDSKYLGRVPNIVKPSEIDYHTTDGTPRFVIQLKEYVMYSGDTTIISELYENVKISIEGSIKNWIDEKGYLLHEDNETWMDARRDYDKVSYSPRSTRANDIQALWYEQLLAGAYFARNMKDANYARKWEELAENVKRNFVRDFTSRRYNYLADRLDKYDVGDFSIRPNQLFAFDLVEDATLKSTALKVSWEELVYPWGVASLDRNDPFFHPYHLSWENYHKDEAYHNGTIWLWLNGIAMQRMIEFNQVETAYKLFRNMNQVALERGVAGGLGENMDAYPREGESFPKLTGTYLQAWSNAEHLRVWYQYFLGIRPDLVQNVITLAPRIPSEFTDLHIKSFIGEGFINYRYVSEGTIHSYQFNDISADIQLDIHPFEMITVPVQASYTIKLLVGENEMQVILLNEEEEEVERFISEKSQARLTQQKSIDQVLHDIEFCQPMDVSNHEVLNKKYNNDERL